MTFIPDVSLPPTRQESKEHFVLHRSHSVIQVLPLTGFGGCWLSDTLGTDSCEITTAGAFDLMLILALELNWHKESPTLD